MFPQPVPGHPAPGEAGGQHSRGRGSVPADGQCRVCTGTGSN